MKKIFSALLVAICICMAMPTQAQINFGVKGGLNLSKASFSKADFKKDNFTGFFIGPMAEFKIPVVGLGLDGALLFSQRGIEVEGTKIKQNGLDIPINLKYNIGLGSLLGVYLAAGPDFYFDFEKNKQVWDADNYSIRTDKKRTEVGINLGAGVKLVNHLQVGFNYNIPLGDSAKLIDSDAESASYKTKTWQVSIAYLF
ncbi:porin family protein [Bacteroides faecalis]|uniref:Membrane protein n=1 Tax=Bacteroides faecalis TaxID=2447885 RepID=A0A401M0X4_9BACE|nr:porin family protein [Bacteroides faecalis]GCB37461.1 membrane protein [Bacteroides faecalis]